MRTILTVSLLTAILAAAGLFGQGKPGSTVMPIWRLYVDGHTGVMVPLNKEGRPFTVEGQIRDSGGAVVLEFEETTVNTPVFTKLFPPFSLSPDTYRLNVTLTDKAQTKIVLDHFPPVTVPDRWARARQTLTK